MRFILGVVGVWLGLASTVAAYNALEVLPPAPYEPYEVAAPFTDQRTYLGRLDDFPDMYELTSDQSFTLELKLDTLPEQASLPELAVIIVSVSPAGVTEVERLGFADAAWEAARDGTTGLTFLTGPEYTTELEAGTYRIEVSTPENTGPYRLTIGDESSGVGYFATLANIVTTYKFAGVSRWGMIRSSYVYYPLGILLLLGLIYGTWRWRKTI